MTDFVNFNINGTDVSINATGVSLSSINGLTSDSVQDGIEELNSNINVFTEDNNSDLNNSDLDITDENGYILARLEEGHIKTKNFSSDELQLTDSFYDLEITDIDGSAIIRVNSGHIRTSNFNSVIVLDRISTLEDSVQESNPYSLCKNYGKSVAVFGGSFSVIAESEAAKNEWNEKLNMTITNYGVSGAGFSSLQGTSIQQQVDNCIDSSIQYDIYVLWASTNDFTNSREVGEYTDYTTLDSYDESKLVTQCGGINYAIKNLMEYSPTAEIYFFTGLRFFTSESGYNPYSEVTNNAGYTFVNYIEAQKKCCFYWGVSVLDQFAVQDVNILNYTNFYKTDKLHMSEEGYKRISLIQVEFLKMVIKHIWEKDL